MGKYSLGIDFGSLSARAIIVDVANGKQMASASSPYAHGVLEEMDGKPLGAGWALQDPADYQQSMIACVKAAVAESGVPAEDIIGIGVDFTACSVLPIKNDGTPISQVAGFETNPHAYVKMWKHHAAQPYADRINALAKARNEAFLQKYDAISSEWLIPKIMQVMAEAPEVYSQMDKFIEAGDWIVMQLTGKDSRNSCAAGYKGQYDPATGYMNKAFLKALDPRLENIEEEKLGKVVPSGTWVGGLNETYAELLGLKAGTGVAAATIDAHAAVPAVGIAAPAQMLMIMGTSTCHMMLHSKEVCFKGLCGVVKDGIIPGFYGYEAGQCAVGDIFQWVIDEIVPKKYFDQAQQAGMDIFAYMSRLAAECEDENLVALDWWNGCRSPLMDGNLKGAISGLTLKTTAVDIFKATVEATAFGTRRIIEAFESSGVAVDRLYACGGIATKNSYMMQVYADITGKAISVAASGEAVAHGSAVFGALAAGKAKGGYDDVAEAIGKMSCGYSGQYLPNAEKQAVYAEKYVKYLAMSDHFSK
ncbi:MAG: ribulokinase [Oscillospiraceae bacterium]|nr:ribulokinase [Oscillospiraceae bacterium]